MAGRIAILSLLLIPSFLLRQVENGPAPTANVTNDGAKSAHVSGDDGHGREAEGRAGP